MQKNQPTPERCDGMKVLYRADVTDPSFAPAAARIEAPEGDGFLDLTDAAGAAKVALIFFGTGQWMNRATARLIGWRLASGKTPLWLPVPLLNFNIGLGSVAGVDGTAVDSQHRFASEIAISRAFCCREVDIASAPDDQIIAEAHVTCRGARHLQVILAPQSEGAAVNVLAQRI